ncbi:hypothetical protein [Amycolatopsis vastitatis]|uniref:hypothetical protein n=1 Tax=Amycolatopsis vastitatis TaxID=1905142 RepID=UPI0034E024E3
MVDNLLANDLRATGPGTTITLASTRGLEGDVELHIIDQRPGMTAEQRATRVTTSGATRPMPTLAKAAASA